MKKRIENFLNTYFYFNTQEKKGIRVLLVLMAFLQIVLLLAEPIFTPEVSEIKWVKLQSLPESNAFSDNGYDGSKIYSDAKSLKQNNWKNYSPAIKKEYKKFEYKKAENRSAFVSIEINNSDSAALESLPGIGPVLAQRIIKYRNSLGGFYSLNQLNEIWGMDPELPQKLEGKILLDSSAITYLDINQASREQLAAHPYIRYKLASMIVNYRNQHGRYSNAGELLQLKQMSDSTLKKLQPYLRFN